MSVKEPEASKKLTSIDISLAISSYKMKKTVSPSYPWYFGRNLGGLFRLMPRKYQTAFVTGVRVFSITCPLSSLRPELMATLFKPYPRSAA
ncbi:hypothetical protein TNCV_4844121 [Trichonephila clavipes]|uniref:Uncharacterized protein n=1 Tax=Trichonephila clavipes TaxID=2585209 RepID=A0A8X6WJS0_TRICX|nr:hypothetical protein TNCV_4844121 [Trichonephila clavipes]